MLTRFFVFIMSDKDQKDEEKAEEYQELSLAEAFKELKLTARDLVDEVRGGVNEMRILKDGVIPGIIVSRPIRGLIKRRLILRRNIWD